MARKKPKDVSFESCPPNGLLCAIDGCGKPQRDTPGGPSCGDHGGAPGYQPPKKAELLVPADARVSVVHVASRALVTIEATAALWSALRTGETTSFPKVNGAIVRMRPPADATDEEVAGMRALLEARGAERVIALARPKGDVLPAKLAAKLATAPRGAREVVLGLVEEANAKDRNKLRELAEKVMAEVGL